MKVGGEWTWVLLVSAGIVCLASVPYVFGYAIAPSGYSFLGLTHNADDALVYLSWMRQSVDGSFFLRNLFTTEPQAARNFNLLFYALGRFAGLTHLSLVAVFHIARAVLGLGLLLLIYAFSGSWTADLTARRLALLVAGLSSGLGWLVPAGEGINRPVDLWQPEAITFLSIYLSPLFAFSLILILGGLWLLYLHAVSGRLRFAIGSGVLLLILGNVHSYDLVVVAIAWAAFALSSLTKPPRSARPIVGGLIAGLIASPSVAYQAYLYAREPVFRLRADVPTLSPASWFYLVGLGLLVPLTVAGIRRLRTEGGDFRLLVSWALAAIISSYLPVAFQRKLIMGIHIPLSILGGIGLATVVRWPKKRWFGVLTAGWVAVLALSNLSFLGRDMHRIAIDEAHTTAHPPFIAADELAALDWLRGHSNPGEVVLAEPWTASLIPAWTGLPVYCGHWGETARFGEKLRETLAFFEGSRDLDVDDQFIKRHRIAFIMDCHRIPSLDDRLALLGFVAAFRSDAVTVYRAR